MELLYATIDYGVSGAQGGEHKISVKRALEENPVGTFFLRLYYPDRKVTLLIDNKKILGVSTEEGSYDI